MLGFFNRGYSSRQFSLLAFDNNEDTGNWQRMTTLTLEDMVEALEKWKKLRESLEAGVVPEQEGVVFTEKHLGILSDEIGRLENEIKKKISDCNI